MHPRRGKQKGEVVFKVLKALGGAALITADLFSTIIESPYGASYNQLSKRLDLKRRNREVAGETYRKRRNFYVLISKLKKEGLIVQEKKRGGKAWNLTRNGLEKLGILNDHHRNALPQNRYKKETDDKLKIVIFDIPERERKKRQWLRQQLGCLGFTLLQQSVWIGKTKLPEKFIEDLEFIDLLPYVEIFSVSRTGSINNLKIERA